MSDDPGTVFVLVRTDLDESQRLVQAVHAVAKLVGSTAGGRSWSVPGGTLVVLGVENEDALEAWFDELDGSDFVALDFVVFSEPDLGYRPTAIAVLAEAGAATRIAKQMFRLLRPV